MAHSLELDVVAEGIEEEAQLRFLQGLGCAAYQGYLFSKPVPAAQLLSMLNRAGTGDTHVG
jgi:EAL domain-containing protein (putative c-di-GMP-specific phosphodiesterase class I)